MAIATYKPSGRFHPKTFVFALGALVAVALLAWPYQLLLRVIPLIYLNLLLVGGFAIAAGGAAFLAIHQGLCRNRVVAIAIGLLVAAAALAASYYWEARHIMGESGAPDLWTALQLKREAGWSIGRYGSKTELNGLGVDIIWGIEALVVLIAVEMMALMAATAAFCERCRRFTDSASFTVPGASAAEAQPFLDREDLGGLATLQPPANGPGDVALLYQVHTCAGCSETAFLSVAEQRTVQKGKKQETQTKSLVSLALLDAQNREQALERTREGVPRQKLPG